MAGFEADSRGACLAGFDNRTPEGRFGRFWVEQFVGMFAAGSVPCHGALDCHRRSRSSTVIPILRERLVVLGSLAGRLLFLLATFFLGSGFVRPLVALPTAIALAGDVDDLGMMQEAIEDGAGRGHVADQLAPILKGRFEVIIVLLSS